MENLLLIAESGMGKTMLLRKFQRDHALAFDAVTGDATASDRPHAYGGGALRRRRSFSRSSRRSVRHSICRAGGIV